MIRLRKSSSPSRWLMGLPPTSPRLKFVHTHPGGSPVPRRPPRHPPSPSTRSRSLELLDQEEKKSTTPAAKPAEPLPRPRSRSLDGLLDEDGMVPDLKTDQEPSPETNSENSNENDASLEDSTIDEKSENKSNTVHQHATTLKDTSQENTQESNALKSATKDSERKLEAAEQSVSKVPAVVISDGESSTSEQASNSSRSRESASPSAIKSPKSSPTPIPRYKARAMNVLHGAEGKLDVPKMARQENTRISSSSDEISDREESKQQPVRPPKPNRCVSVDSPMVKRDSANVRESQEREDERKGAGSKERLPTAVAGNDKSMLLKARSCGAGLDSDESVSSNDYKPKTKKQSSLLSLPTGAEPKRKRNFMDKCVNKVRSFIRK